MSDWDVSKTVAHIPITRGLLEDHSLAQSIDWAAMFADLTESMLHGPKLRPGRSELWAVTLPARRVAKLRRELEPVGNPGRFQPAPNWRGTR